MGVSDRDEAALHQAVNGTADSRALPASASLELVVREPVRLLAFARPEVPPKRLPNDDTQNPPLRVGEARHHPVEKEVRHRCGATPRWTSPWHRPVDRSCAL